MTIETLKELLSGLDPESLLQKVLPDLGPMLESTQIVARVLMLVGPFVILAMGLYYFLNAPKEANYLSGYRCHFGMGSVEAWQYTQRLAGGIWVLLGLGMAVWMALAGKQLVDLPMVDALGKMAGWILWQAFALLLSRLVIHVLVFLRYDRKGVRRYTWAELWKG